MCVNCVTNAEAVVFQAVAGVGMVGGVIQRRRFRRARPGERLARETRTWQANAEFMRSLGLEPVTVLGPPPSPERGEVVRSGTQSELVAL